MTHEIDLHEDIGEILLTEEQIQGKVRELGARISADYRGRRLTLVSVLKGSLPFMADLMRAIDIPVRIDLMEVSSYGGTATESSGLVRILKDLSGEHRRRGRPDRRGHHRHRPDPELPDPLPAREEPGLAPHLHAARQARPPAGGDPRGLHGLRHPRPVRRRLRAGLRGVLPEPARAWASCARRSTPRSRRSDDASAPARPRAHAGRDRGRAHGRRLRAAVVDGGRRRHRDHRGERQRLRGRRDRRLPRRDHRRSRSSRCRTPPATGRSGSTAGSRS